MINFNINLLHLASFLLFVIFNKKLHCMYFVECFKIYDRTKDFHEGLFTYL